MELIIVLLFSFLTFFAIAWLKASGKAQKSENDLRQATTKNQEQAAVLQELEAQLKADKAAIAELEPYRVVKDAKDEAARVRQNAAEDLSTANVQAKQVIAAAREEEAGIRKRANEELGAVKVQAQQVIAAAREEEAGIRKRANEELGAAKVQAQQVIATAREESGRIKALAKEALDKARVTAEQKLAKVQQSIAGAHDQAQAIIQKAKQEAEQIAGDAYVAMQKADSLQKTLQALEDAVKGYGDAYLVPTHSLLDDLADEFSHTDAGNNLRRAREHTIDMMLQRTAGICDYVETNRRETAISFVTDAFNGKVDSILSRVKSDNVGNLEREIRNAFQLVNYHGTAFRNARLTNAYLESRLDELRWAATAKALQDQEREEQRRLREQIREEERARKEFERAMKDAEKEEATIHKAMEKVQAQVQKANAEQKAAFEAQLAELTERLRLAEEKSQRALSMAQQTRVGHVYVISNIGSFGENVYKIGMTRRLEPLDRVRELGDASVPFEFDVHAMIYSEDAPKLEKSLHSHFMRAQVNKVNPRKEFFRVGINEIMGHVVSTGIQAHWTLTAKAASFRESQRIEQSLLGNTEEGQRWAEIQAETIEADESQEETEPA